MIQCPGCILDRVFDALADPLSLALLDMRVGGRFRIFFGGPDGKRMMWGGFKLVVDL